MHHIQSHTRSPPKQQDLRNPLLQRNRTQSEVSYEGNTIDMVRIVRKNQENRRSLANIDRREYLNHQMPHNQPYRHSQTQQKPQHQTPISQHDARISSTFVHKGTDLNQSLNPNFIEHYIRPSNVNLLNEMNEEGSNKVLGLTLFCLFLILFSCETLICCYFLHACHVIFDHFDYILVLNYAYYDEVFEKIEKQNFLAVLTLYLTIEILYHIVIFLINLYTNGKYKLIDKETSRISYIMKYRNLNRNSQSTVQKIIHSPKFTIFLILLSTVLHCYGIVHCYYFNEMNLSYVYFMSSPIIMIIELFYFAVLLPEIWKYLFFDRMHTHNDQALNDSHSEESQTWRLPPLTDFTLEHWWIRLALVVLLLSLVYSLLVSFWLIVVSFSKIQISFKKMKYKIDTFYLQAIGKAILFIICAFTISSQPFSTFLTLAYSIQCIFFLIIAFLLTRILAHIFLRHQLYKYLYSEMHINLGNIVWVFGVVYVVNQLMGEIQLWAWDVLFVGAMCLALSVSLLKEENHRLLISFSQEDKLSDGFVQMGSL